jgi:hypothetical protein
MFLALIAFTGFFLATKGSLGWVRPPEKDGQKIEDYSGVVSVHQAAEAAFAHGLPELRSMADVDRIDYRPGSNVFKVVSNEGYQEIQVDGSSGEVLQVAFRRDQLFEDLHDLSFFTDWLHTYWLPVVAVLLLTLSLTGISIWLTPVIRRARYRASKR